MAVNRKLIAPLVGGLVGVAVIAGGTVWWMGKQRYERTDNAFVQADTVSVSPQVTGYVQEVLVSDNQHVEPGQVLVRIDPASIQARLDQATANAQALEAQVRSVDDKAALEQALIAQRAAGVTSAAADEARARADAARYADLANQGWVSAQRVQQVQATATQTRAAVASAQAALEAERRSAESLGSLRAQNQAQAAAARAQAEAARIDLDRTVIRAPISGAVGARAVRPGQLVQPGLSLMSIVPLGRAYVVANFKETQVARLRIGQPVEIKADAFGGEPIRGRIESFAPATGAEFALIPVENAVGNFTKIAQRLPVRIAIDGAQPLAAGLRPGLSVEVKVDVTDRSGPSFAESGRPGAAYAQHGVTQ